MSAESVPSTRLCELTPPRSLDLTFFAPAPVDPRAFDPVAAADVPFDAEHEASVVDVDEVVDPDELSEASLALGAFGAKKGGSSVYVGILVPNA